MVRALLFATLVAGLAGARTAPDAGAPSRPNLVVILTDDQGYGDLSCFGSPTIHTPRVDALAAGGMKLTQFYVGAPVCSPSRAALLTGCYPKRVGMERRVVFPQDDHGLATDELTLADLLRSAGYATGCFGKWHLGHRPGLMPTDQGFDEFFGVPYSNDMAQFHRAPDAKYVHRLPLMRGAEVVEWEPDQHLLTRRTTEAAVDFIEQHADEPFFLYLPHSMPHIPIYASEPFEGTSPRGLYGDVIEELDWSVGRVVDALAAHDLLDDTLILYTSDNGPWLSYLQRGGSAGPLRGGKATNWEGGQRVPCVVHWPAAVPAGRVCRELTTAMDLLPTVAALVGAELPDEPARDGHDIGPLLRGEEGARSPTDCFLYYTTKGELAGVRRGPWKLLLATGELYQVEHDIGEQWDRAAERPELAEELRQLALGRDAEIEAAARPALHVEAQLFDPRRPDARGR